MCLSIVNYETHTFADFQEVADLFGHRCCFRADFNAVTRCEVLFSLLRKVLIGLQFKLDVFCWPRGNGKLKFSCVFIYCDNFFAPVSILAIVKLVNRQRVEELMGYDKAWVLHEHLCLSFEPLVVLLLAKLVQHRYSVIHVLSVVHVQTWVPADTEVLVLIHKLVNFLFICHLVAQENLKFVLNVLQKFILLGFDEV